MEICLAFLSKVTITISARRIIVDRLYVGKESHCRMLNMMESDHSHYQFFRNCIKARKYLLTYTCRENHESSVNKTLRTSVKIYQYKIYLHQKLCSLLANTVTHVNCVVKY